MNRQSLLNVTYNQLAAAELNAECDSIHLSYFDVAVAAVRIQEGFQKLASFQIEWSLFDKLTEDLRVKF